MPCHGKPSVPPELGDKRLQWHSDPERTRRFFPYERYYPIHVQNRLREPHYHVYTLHSWLLQPVFEHGSDCRSGRAWIDFRRRRRHVAIGLVIDWCVSGPNDVAQVWLLHFIWVLLPFTNSPSLVGTRHKPPIHCLAENCKIHVWLPCTPQPLCTESSVFHGKAIHHMVIPVISFTWSSGTPSTNKMSTFTESFDDAIDSVAMETNFSAYIPIWTSIPPISYNYSSHM